METDGIHMHQWFNRVSWCKAGLQKCDFRDFSGSPVVKTVLPLQGVWVRSLFWEVRSHMLHSEENK